MKEPSGPGEDQSRWNEFGKARLREMSADQDRFQMATCPIAHLEAHGELLRRLAPLPGKDILELGCGRGDFSVWLARQGARVTALDIGTDLIAAARSLAELNQVRCTFMQGDIASLPWAAGTFDAVIGIAILHHLQPDRVPDVLRECFRVLKPGGIAAFHEPVENSRIFDCLQNLLPAGRKGSGQFRPSILQRRAWRRHIEKSDDRVMTSRELAAAGCGLFQETALLPYGFSIRLERLLGKGARRSLQRLDRRLLRLLPPLRRYSQTVLALYQKGLDPHSSDHRPA